MSNYCFCYSNDPDEIEKLRSAAIFAWGKVRQASISDFVMFFPETDYEYCFAQTSSGTIGAVSGYVRHDDINGSHLKGIELERNNNQKFIEEIIKSDGWPLDQKWTGSFAAVSFSKKESKIVICNDLLGYLPIYTVINSKCIIGGTSLIVLARSIKCSVDPIGVLQRIHPYYPCCGGNFGKRTIIKQVSRLLPGERNVIATENLKVATDFDHSLCGEVIDGNIDDIANLVWNEYKKEVSIALGGEDDISLALSGGWDSRLILGALRNDGLAINCLTFGNEDVYESEIAKRCASASYGKNIFFPLEKSYFPLRSEFERLIKNTEFAYFLSYYPIIKRLGENNKPNSLLLVGDLSDGITGKGMRDFYTRKYRMKSFLNSCVGIDVKLSESSYESFLQWKLKKTKNILDECNRFVNLLQPKLATHLTMESMSAEIQKDLELDFMRIEKNFPKFTPMFDELFTWFHYTRCGMASQLILLNFLFRTLCPPMSMRFLRLISRVHPRLKVNRKLIDAIINLPELNHLNRIPSAQIPYVSSKSPKVIKESIWALRAFLDDFFMKRALKKQNPFVRQQFIKWHNLTKEYGRKETPSIVQEWFSGEWIKEKRFVDIVKSRGGMSSWPHLNSDIAIPANVSMLLDLCEADIN